MQVPGVRAVPRDAVPVRAGARGGAAGRALGARARATPRAASPPPRRPHTGECSAALLLPCYLRANGTLLLQNSLMQIRDTIVLHTSIILERSKHEMSKDLRESLGARVRELLLQIYKLGFEVRNLMDFFCIKILFLGKSWHKV